LIHNFGSRYARKPIKGSKDSDDSLVSKEILSEKIGSLDCCDFFSVMKFVKSSHRATLKNENVAELICTALTTYCPDFR